MALISCSECGRELSDKAKTCPHCGCPITTEEPATYISQAKTEAPKKHTFAIILVVLFIIVIASIGFVIVMRLMEHNQPSNSIEGFIDDVFNRDILSLEEVDPSVVTVYCYDMYGKEYGEELGSGSGFIAFDDQTVVTNFHVYEAGEDIRVVAQNGKEYLIDSAIALSAQKDIAILKIAEPTGLVPLSFGDPNALDKGSPVTAIGSPLGLDNTVSQGIISRKYNESSMSGITILQTTAPISPGSSGGALFDESFHVIGVTFAGYDEGQNLNLAIPINVVSDIYKLKNTDDESVREENLHDIAIYSDIEEARNASYFFNHPEYQNEIFNLAKEIPTYLERQMNIKQGKENPYVYENAQDLLIRHKILNYAEYAIAVVMTEHVHDVEDRAEIIVSWDLDYEEALIVICSIGGFDWYDLSDDMKEDICNYFFYTNDTILDARQCKNILEGFGYEVVEESDGSITAYW